MNSYKIYTKGIQKEVYWLFLNCIPNEMLFQKDTAKIYPSNKYNVFPSFIIDQLWNTLQLKNIVLSFHPPF